MMPTLFFIHGLWSRPSTFATLRQELAAAGLPSVAITLPYHDLPPGSPAPMPLGKLKLADYVASLRRDLAAVEGPVIVVGHSMGGLLAQLLTAASPGRVRGLALLSTAPSAQTQLHAISLSSIKAVAGMTLHWGWWAEPLLIDQQVARHAVYNGVSEEETRVGLADLTWDSGAVLAQISAPLLDPTQGSRVDYSALQRPALVIAGLEDQIVPPGVSRSTARLLTANGASVDYEEWPGVGHWLFHDAVRPRLGAAISRFMASL